MFWMHIVFLMKKSQGGCNTQPQTGTESELPQGGQVWCDTLHFSLAPSGHHCEKVVGRHMLTLKKTTLVIIKMAPMHSLHFSPFITTVHLPA